MGAWRGHPSVKPGAAMHAAVRVVRDRAPLRRTAAASAPISYREQRGQARPARGPMIPWTRNGAWYPNRV